VGLVFFQEFRLNLYCTGYIKAWLYAVVFISLTVSELFGDNVSVSTHPLYTAFCKTTDNKWHRVLHQSKSGVQADVRALDFRDLWQPVSNDKNKTAATKSYKWSDLKMPLPDPGVETWGYAMTYTDHKDEVRIDDSVIFRKHTSAVSANSDISYRPYLDYETEIGVLLNRNATNLFGYIIANDWTDREIQVNTYDPDDMAPGFSKSKSFEGSLHVGSLLVIGDHNLWPQIKIKLFINGHERQDLSASDCTINPTVIHDQIFNELSTNNWVLVATGTDDGVQFHTPGTWQKIGLFIRSGFSKRRAGKRWLNKLSFMKKGDRVEFRSDMLGYSSATVSETNSLKKTDTGEL
jgi:2-keto-4-pentenoate hydratase/2-oxohepta-3-ene-1,7-dioic acid hydratase in catechol pathway